MTQNSTMQHSDDTLSIALEVSAGRHSPTQNDMETTCPAYCCTCLEDYSRAMLTYTQRQVSFLVDRGDDHGSSFSASPSTSTSVNSHSSISSGNCAKSEVPANSVLHHQGPGPSNHAEAEEIEQQTANSAGCSQA
ncbi:hypothetical protein PENFLA_c100G00964 [Penicillium flavigenum]|uniref:Uncharacterized protein n=1 Tax=Penicillium flavigenum TaxID=254877 RepID=A0A1V6S778_9EURO|nr:hypothetical protein PENFLA_c100G00964 [Penicillium flavigenum]